MFAILFQVVGLIIFALTTFACGRLIRGYKDLELAKTPIRVVQLFYWLFLVLPAWIEFFYPGYTHLDSSLGIVSLPFMVPLLVLGLVLFLLGIYYGAASSKMLARIGHGAAAFKFSMKLVDKGVYDTIRNPMALGYYLMLIGVGLMAHSTYFLAFNFVFVIPVHIFYIKYFEEFEVSMRLGQSYKEYKQRTPFIIPKFSRQ